MGGWHYKYCNPDGSPQDSWSASFQLQGTPSAGQLDIFSPLGSQLALLHWSPDGGLAAPGQRRNRVRLLPALIERSLGTAVPIGKLFRLADKATPCKPKAGSADLGQYTQGRISARRTRPAAASAVEKSFSTRPLERAHVLKLALQPRLH